MKKKLTLYHKVIMQVYFTKTANILATTAISETETVHLLVPFFMLCRRDDYKINAISSLYILGKIIPSTWFPLPTLIKSIETIYSITPFKFKL